jgi:uncharacterized membrane protein HdeD (DUF308 family)
MLYKSKADLIFPIIFIVLGILFCIPKINFLQIIICIGGCAIFIYGLYMLISSIIEISHQIDAYFQLTISIFVMLIGILFSSLVWVLFFIFALIFGIIFICYGLFGIYGAIVNPSLTLKDRILSLIINILYLAIGILFIININNEYQIISYVLGGLLIFDGLIGLIEYISYQRNLKKFFTKPQYQKEDKIVIDVDFSEKD